MKFLSSTTPYFVLALLLSCFFFFIESTFVFTYLRANIIGLLLTLLAINTATTGLIASKLIDLSLANRGFNFSPTLSEMKFSLIEQIILIVASIAVLSVQESSMFKFEFKDFACNTMILFLFIYAIALLYDTGKAIFTLADCIQNFQKQ